MFARVNCPACQYKFTIPEGDMGKRHSCPNCQSPFLAGKSVGEAEVPMKLEPAAASAANKTMLGETGPPIRYNCPRCKMPLEALAIEAGTKKPCPGCGQRIQVPAAPPPAAPPPPAINKTMLAETEPPIKYNCPNCKKSLESPSIEAGTKKPCPACGQRLQVPAASSGGAPKPNLNKTILATDESKSSSIAPGAPSLSPQAAQTTAGSAQSSVAVAPPQGKSMKPLLIVGGAVGGLLFLGTFACLIVILFTGPSKADREKYELAMKEIEKAKKEVEELQKKIQQEQATKNRIEQEKAEAAAKWVAFQANMEKDQARFDAQQKQYQQQLLIDQANYKNDQAAKAKAEAIYEANQRALEQERKANAERLRLEAEKVRERDAQLAREREENRRALEAANQRREQQTVIISQPPQPIYYPPFHPFGPYGWRGW